MAPPAASRPAGSPAHPRRHRARLDLTGLIVATALLCLSFTPSLLPRTWLVQGVLSGLTAATGYGIGAAAGYAIRLGRSRIGARAAGWLGRSRIGARAAGWLGRSRIDAGDAGDAGGAGRIGPARARRWVLRTYAVAALATVPPLVCLGWHWQVQICAVLRVRPPSVASWSLVLPAAAAVFALLLGVGRLVRHAAYGIVRLLRSRGRRHLAAAALVLLAALAHGFVSTALLRGADRAAERLDGPAPGLAAPVDATRSGSPGSYVPWASLDKQGQLFVVGAPSPADLERTGGRPAKRPVRVYVGVRSAPDAASRARLAVRELERTGAGSRRVLCIVVPTGTGWVDEPTIQALEYRYHGDTALVAVQYSAMPSWLSFLAAPGQARDAATRVLAEVHRWWSSLPAGSRPQLLIYGHSLGAVGARAALGSPVGPVGPVDGALISGLPDGNSLVRTSVAPASARMVYLAHPTDPVAWWSPRLLLLRPDWLARHQGGDGLPTVRWYPVVTFWQISADMLAALHVPAGYGHSYGAESPGAWAVVTAGGVSRG